MDIIHLSKIEVDEEINLNNIGSYEPRLEKAEKGGIEIKKNEWADGIYKRIPFSENEICEETRMKRLLLREVTVKS